MTNWQLVMRNERITPSVQFLGFKHKGDFASALKAARKLFKLLYKSGRFNKSELELMGLIEGKTASDGIRAYDPRRGFEVFNEQPTEDHVDAFIKEMEVKKTLGKKPKTKNNTKNRSKDIAKKGKIRIR